MGVRIEIPDAPYYRRLIRCMEACPIGTDAGGYVQAIAEGRDREGFELAAAPNSFVSVCARVCAHPCESACRRGFLDEPVAIRALKRFLTERFGVEARGPLPVVKVASATRMPRSADRIAIVGAGPAGIACAAELARLGYRSTLFEATQSLGGMLHSGIPSYRLGKDLLRWEIERNLSPLIEVRTGVRFGQEMSLSNLWDRGYVAAFLSVGCGVSRRLSIDGIDLDGVLMAVDFLLNVNMGYRVALGRRVLVVGDGNVAFDPARSAARVQDPEAGSGGGESLRAALDAARTAAREGVREVTMCCLESWEEMPADAEEIRETRSEGIRILPRKGPKRLVGLNGHVVGLETLDVTRVFDEKGAFSPQFERGSEEFIKADTVILAIGQAPNFSFLKPEDAVAVTPRGLLQVDRTTLRTTNPRVWAGGDAAFGPRMLIEAVSDGRRVAREIHESLSGQPPPRLQAIFTPIPRQQYHTPPDFERLPRRPVPSTPLEHRLGMAEVEVGYGEEEAREAARRCLRCHINTVFDSSKCIMCGGCVDVCPERCLRIVPLSALPATGPVEAVLSTRTHARSEAGAAILKDERRCTRCALCMFRCPSGAITMERVSFPDLEPPPLISIAPPESESVA
ncbi:MAG: FAD-dependent oxidoreductase [Candidatus Wallbacteria bacterium]|nr:FAD-dependent oxidoreductase [Candidatus Wallbacteria bacterium]